MNSQDIALVIKSMIENNLITDTHIYFVIFLVTFFVLRKFINPIKDLFSKFVKKDDLAELKDSLFDVQETHETMTKEIEKSLDTINRDLSDISEKLNKMELKNEINAKTLEQIHDELVSVKTFIENVFITKVK